MKRLYVIGGPMVAGGAAVLLGVGLYARTIGGDAGKREEREP